MNSPSSWMHYDRIKLDTQMLVERYS